MNRLKMVISISVMVIITILSFESVKQYLYLKDADTFYEKKDFTKSIDAYCMVLYNHIPFSPLEKRALQKLYMMIKEFDNETFYKLYLYERLRSSILGTRSFYTPHKEVLAQIEPKIAQIKADLLIKDGYKKSYEDTYNEIQNIMKKDLAPDPLMAFSSILLFFLTIFVVIRSIQACVVDNNFNYKHFCLYLPVICFLFILWIYTLYKA